MPVGGYRVVYEYANHLIGRGHQVFVVHTRQRVIPGLKASTGLYRSLRRTAGTIRDRFVRPKVTWHTIDDRVKMIYAPDLTARHIPDGDAVVATAWWTADYVVNYPESKGTQFYLVQHYETWSGPKDRVDTTWRYPLRKIVIARWLYDLGLELGVPRAEMRHIPNGIDHQKYEVFKPIEARPNRVAMLFAHQEWKGAQDGITALELVKRDHPDVQAVLFGVSERPSGLPAWIEYRENPGQHELVGEIYNGSSIYLCPSWTEGWGLPSAEAMSCGCALVSTDNGGSRDYAEHDKTALLAPPRRPDLLAQRLRTLLEYPDLRMKLAREGNRRIRTFTWERATDVLEAWMQQARSQAKLEIDSVR
ncbi:glycosyltransferase family 4 protein [Limnochorda pilosa]|uniref:glycosyltransferase family 4 protein n=1 Tax=Limnochorda pilosa TaxID=1555112 RepID=UPI00130DA7EE|nr:glycosyltransferase family 4 protein [Limnochorda pilosa]